STSRSTALHPPRPVAFGSTGNPRTPAGPRPCSTPPPRPAFGSRSPPRPESAKGREGIGRRPPHARDRYPLRDRCTWRRRTHPGPVERSRVAVFADQIRAVDFRNSSAAARLRAFADPIPKFGFAGRREVVHSVTQDLPG